MPTLFCLGCGYSLRGIEPGRCPECGRPWTPKQLAAEYAVLAGSAARDSMWFWLAPIVVVVMVTAGIGLDIVRGGPLFMFVCPVVCVIGLVILDAGIAWREEQRRRLMVARDELLPVSYLHIGLTLFITLALQLYACAAGGFVVVMILTWYY